MLDLDIIFGGTPPALRLLLLVGTWIGAYWLYYILGQSRKVRTLVLIHQGVESKLSGSIAHAYPVDCVWIAAFLLPGSLELFI